MNLIYLKPINALFSLFLYHTLSFQLFGYLLAVKFTSIYTFLSNSFAIRVVATSSSATFALRLRSHSPRQESSTTDFNQLLESLTVAQHIPPP